VRNFCPLSGAFSLASTENRKRPGAANATGVPLVHSLAHWLAELLLRILETDLRLHTRVRIIRRVDDITCLAPDANALSAAWERLQAFCADTGLALMRKNPVRSRSVESAPRRCPTVCAMGNDRAQRTQGIGRFTKRLSRLIWRRARGVCTRGFLLNAIQGVNLDAQYLLNTSPPPSIWEMARAAITQAVNRFHQDYFENGQEPPPEHPEPDTGAVAQDIETSAPFRKAGCSGRDGRRSGLINLPLMLEQYRLSYRKMSVRRSDEARGALGQRDEERLGIPFTPTA